MHILLTNDDSHSSPLFRFAIDFLKTLGNVTIVVPKTEQSWTGKSMSRFKPLSLSPIRLQEDMAHSLDGTPADCVNMGVHQICSSPPELVVSGINIGFNAGLGYVFSSGTVGACLEANIAGVPAIALSQRLNRPIFQSWMQHGRISDADLERLKSQTTMILGHVFERLLARPDFWRHPVTWNVNLPDTAAPNWQIVPTVLGHTVYGSVFKQSGEQFRHEGGRARTDNREQADGVVLQEGHVSITYIDIRELGQTIVHV